MTLARSTSAERDRLNDVALVPAGVALNVAIAITVSVLKIPIYLDAIGTIAVVLMSRGGGRSPMWMGVFVGVFSFVLTALFFNPTVIWFSHVQAAIAIYTFFVIRPIVRLMEATPGNNLRNWCYIILSGVCLGLITGTLSAPIIALVFSGVTPNGPGFVNALLIATGQSLFRAVFTGGISVEPIDKTLQTILAVSLYMNSPWRPKLGTISA